MTFVYDLVVVLHLLGMAALVGGWLATSRGVGATDVMVWGARAQVLTGLVLVGLAESVDSLDKDLDMAKIGVKLAVAVAAAACIEIARGRSRRLGGDARALVTAAGVLGVLNVLVAVLWS
jgi:hypothetical protein